MAMSSAYGVGGEEPRGFARLTPAARHQAALVGAYHRVATMDVVAQSAKLRAGQRAAWLRKADPDGVLPPAERERRAEALRLAHMAAMTLARWGNRPAKPAKPATPRKPAKTTTPVAASGGGGKRGGKRPYWWLDPSEAAAS